MANTRNRTLYFSDEVLMARFDKWCIERGVAPGKAIQTLIMAFIDDLELQRHQFEITIPTREVKFV